MMHVRLLPLLLLPAALGLNRPAKRAPARPAARPKPTVAPAVEPTPGVPYWKDPRIHNLGNVGLGGAVHALVAPLATHMIDRVAYGGVNARKLVHDVIDPSHTVVDLCCGVGFSTHAKGTGVDTSPQMIGAARMRRPGSDFFLGNAEDWGKDGSFDVVTVMFALHEMPRDARRRVIRNAARVARRQVLLVDVDPAFTPAEAMLAGEPYVLEYCDHIDQDVREVGGLRAWRRTRATLVKDHVVMWKLDL